MDPISVGTLVVVAGITANRERTVIRRLAAQRHHHKAIATAINQEVD